MSSFDDEKNAEIVGMPAILKVNIQEVCEIVKKYDFTLQLRGYYYQSFAQKYIGLFMLGSLLHHVLYK